MTNLKELLAIGALAFSPVAARNALSSGDTAPQAAQVLAPQANATTNTIWTASKFVLSAPGSVPDPEDFGFADFQAPELSQFLSGLSHQIPKEEMDKLSLALKAWPRLAFMGSATAPQIKVIVASALASHTTQHR